jgi:hypothetical protein
MPIVKHRPNLAEVVSVAAVHKQRAIDHQRRSSIAAINPAAVQGLSVHTLSASQKSRLHQSPKSSCKNDDTLPENVSLFEYISRLFHAILHTVVMHWLLFIFVILAFTALSIATIYPDRKDDAPLRTLDMVVDIYFIVEGTFKLLAYYTHYDLLIKYKKKVTFIHHLHRCGLLDVTIAVLSLVMKNHNISIWVRLIRVLIITTFVLDATPHLEILMVINYTIAYHSNFLS